MAQLTICSRIARQQQQQFGNAARRRPLGGLHGAIRAPWRRHCHSSASSMTTGATVGAAARTTVDAAAAAGVAANVNAAAAVPTAAPGGATKIGFLGLGIMGNAMVGLAERCGCAIG